MHNIFIYIMSIFAKIRDAFYYVASYVYKFEPDNSNNKTWIELKENAEIV